MMDHSKLIHFSCQNQSVKTTTLDVSNNMRTAIACSTGPTSLAFDIYNKPKLPWWYCDEDLATAGLLNYQEESQSEERHYDKFAPIGVFQNAVRIGPEFQVQVSPRKICSDSGMDCEVSMWIPPSEDVCSAAELSNFLKECEGFRLGQDAPAIHRSFDSPPDDEDALSLLLAEDYNVDRALAEYLAKIQLIDGDMM